MIKVSLILWKIHVRHMSERLKVGQGKRGGMMGNYLDVVWGIVQVKSSTTYFCITLVSSKWWYAPSNSNRLMCSTISTTQAPHFCLIPENLSSVRLYLSLQRIPAIWWHLHPRQYRRICKFFLKRILKRKCCSCWRPGRIREVARDEPLMAWIPSSKVPRAWHFVFYCSLAS